MKSIFLVLTWVLCFSFSGCGDDSSGTSGQTFSGAVAFDSGVSGSIEITIPEASAARLSVRTVAEETQNITGRCIYPDGSVTLAGDYNSATGAFTLTGSGFTFTGTFDSETGSFTGSVTGDDGSSGSFSGVDAESNDVLVFCGTFEQGAETGVWILVVNETTATGSYASDQDAKSLIGTRDGDQVVVAVPGDVPVEGDTGAFGTISGKSLDGTIYENGSTAGSFSGTTDACP